jgi:hypothetical protein
MTTMAQTIKVEIEEDAYRLALGHVEAVEDAPRIGQWRQVNCTRDAAQDVLVFFKAALAKGLNPTAAVACIEAYVQIRDVLKHRI